jgi:hypothetical protein
MGEKQNTYRVLIRKSEWKRPLGRPGRRYGRIKKLITEE